MLYSSDIEKMKTNTINLKTTGNKSEGCALFHLVQKVRESKEYFQSRLKLFHRLRILTDRGRLFHSVGAATETPLSTLVLSLSGKIIHVNNYH